MSALNTWLMSAQITSGPIFRALKHGKVQGGRLRDRTVALIVKRQARLAGLDAAKFAGHSLRAGLITQADMNGVRESVIMKL